MMNEYIREREQRRAFLALLDRVDALEKHSTPEVKLPIRLLTPTAKLPTKGSSLAVGLDLYMDGPCRLIYPGTRAVLSTGVAVSVPVGYYGRVAPRSGLATKKGIVVLAGVVDPDYTGEVFVALLNTGDNEVDFFPGDRIAQLILERAAQPLAFQVEALDVTQRGTNGFGSTGVR